MHYFWAGIIGGAWPLVGTVLWAMVAKGAPWAATKWSTPVGALVVLVFVVLGLMGAAGMGLLRTGSFQGRNVAALCGLVLLVAAVALSLGSNGVYYLPAGPLLLAGALMAPVGAGKPRQMGVRWR